MPRKPSESKNGSTNHAGEFGLERSHDLKWSDKKVALFKTLKVLRATSVSTAKSVKVIAEKSSLLPRDVRHYGYHARAGGLIEVAKIEGVTGYCFYLTAKGAALDPVKELKKEKELQAVK